MVNGRLLNIHDIILIGCIAAIVHILARPLFDRIDANAPDSTD